MQEILTLLALIIVLALLGLVVAFSPTLVITEVAVLLKSKKPLLHAIALISGIGLAILLFVLISVILVDPSKEFDLPSRDSVKGGPLLDIALGVALVAFGVIGLGKGNQPKVQKKSRFNPENLLTIRKLFFFGLFKMATSISSVLAILFASRLIKTVLTSPPSQMIASLILISVAIVPFVALASLKIFKPSIFERMQTTFKKAPFAKWKRLTYVTCIIVGCLFVFSGIISRHESSLFGF